MCLVISNTLSRIPLGGIPHLVGRIAILLLCATVSMTGCRTGEALQSMAFAGPATPILVLPVIPACSAPDSMPTSLTNSFFREISARVGSRAVCATDLERLRDLIDPANLRRDGRLSPTEVAALGRLAGCESVFIFELSNFDPYVSQELAGMALLVDVASAAVVREKSVHLSLANKNTWKRYQTYLKETSSFRTGGPVQNEADRNHAAFLSPSIFQRFAAHLVMNELLTGMDSASIDR